MTKGVVDMKEKIFSVLMQTSGAIFGDSPLKNPILMLKRQLFRRRTAGFSRSSRDLSLGKTMADDVLEIFLQRPVSVWSSSRKVSVD